LVPTQIEVKLVSPKATTTSVPKKSHRGIWIGGVIVALLLAFGGVAYANPSLVGLDSFLGSSATSADGSSKPSDVNVTGYVGVWSVYNHTVTIKADGSARFTWSGHCGTQDDPQGKYSCKAVIPLKLSSVANGSILAIWDKPTVTFLDDPSLVLASDSSFYTRQGKGFYISKSANPNMLNIEPYGDDSLGKFLCKGQDGKSSPDDC
jgi:hypothetical protein